MAKSKRRRKQDRAKRQHAAEQRRRVAERRRGAAAALARAERQLEIMRDPESTPEMVATVIKEFYADQPVLPGLADLLNGYRGSVESVAEVAAALRTAHGEGADASPAVLTFEAQVAYLAEDFATARELLDRALEVADDVEDRLDLARHLVQLGRPVDAIELSSGYLTELEHGQRAVAAQGHAIESVRLRLAGRPDGPCPCGLGASWEACCQPRDQAAIDGFLDRSGLYELRTAVADFLSTSEYEGLVADQVLEWQETVRAAGAFEAAEVLERMAIEHAWVAASTDPDADEAAGNDSHTLLSAIAAAPRTTPEIARRAEAWRDHVRYGLWQVAEPWPSPGLWCTELCTGAELYVAFAPEQIEDLPRWSVLLGAVAPIDGAWRAGGSMIRVTPSEADALCEVVQAIAAVVADAVTGTPDSEVLDQARQPAPFGRAEPHGVYASDEAVEPAMWPFIGRVVGTALPRLIGDVQRARTTPPALVNSDGDPMLMTTARVEVNDLDVTMTRLAASLDFDSDPATPEEVTWLGKEVPQRQRAALLAEAQAQLGAQASEEPLNEPGHWVRGQVRVENGQLRVDVNSKQRLARLLAILERVGAEPKVVDQSSVDPAQDMAWPAGPTVLGGGAASPEAGWETAWLDERVPALRDKTPRQAAVSEEQPRLEALLRQFEYDADVLEQRGEKGIDVEWLREQLNMETS